MEFIVLLTIFVIFFTMYVFYSSYRFQRLLRQRSLNKNFLGDFLLSVKGNFRSRAYFAISHRVVMPEEYKSFSRKHRLSFSECYNIVTFKTPDANWEFFFHMVKEGVKYNEILNIRAFPKHNKIRSEGNVEKNYSRLNIFTNNRYLTGILESSDTRDNLKWILRNNGDILLVSGNNLHFKIFVDPKKITVNRVMDIIKAMNFIKNKIYRDDVLEY